jgi:anthranilate synthase component 1
MDCTFPEFKHAVTKGAVIPCSMRLLSDELTPVQACKALRHAHPEKAHFLFESVSADQSMGRYSFLGADPKMTWKGYRGRTEIQHRDGETPTENCKLPWDETLRQWLSSKSWAESIEVQLQQGGFHGGIVGYTSYEWIHEFEPIQTNGTHAHSTDEANTNADQATHDANTVSDTEQPIALWMLFDQFIQFDHVKQTCTLTKLVFPESEDVSSEERIRALYDEAEIALNALSEQILTVETSLDTLQQGVTEDIPFDSPFTKSSFVHAVGTIKEHIYEGDAFQIVLSRALTTTFTDDSLRLYRALRHVNPSPYMFYIHHPEVCTLVGSSPEILVQVKDQTAVLYPIAGTRPRGETPEQDRAFKQDLLEDQKELAEHTMLIDLGRNDLSRVCTHGTIHLSKKMDVEYFSHVMHIVSEVKGTVREDLDALSVLKACFPAGTVSGAPKVSAIQILDSLEPHPRGAYAGAVGYFDFKGNMDTCIAIRTFIIEGDQLRIQAGAGIVADSDADAEYHETLHKSKALRQAVALAKTLT